MRVAERFALPLILLVALGLRLWGIHHGLPYVYNPDENAHFVPRAIGMFGHSLDPQYFVNPPAFTYLLHLAFWVRWGSRSAVGDAFAADPGTAFTIARVLTALLGAASVGLLAWAGARLVDRRVGLVAAALLAVAFLPVHYAHQAVNDVPALAPLCLSLVGIAGVYRDGRIPRLRARGRGARASPARPSTRPGSCCCRSSRHPRPGARMPSGVLAQRLGLRGIGLMLAGAAAVAGFVIANPYALFDLDMFREGLSRQSEASTDGGGKLGLVADSGVLYYVGTLTWGLGLDPGDRGGRRRASGSRSSAAAWRWSSSPRRCCSCSSWACRTASSPAGCCPSTRCCACSRRSARSRRCAACPRPRSSPRCCCARRGSSSPSTTT